jgi:pyruvate dehydrogenase E1 component alpha subunit
MDALPGGSDYRPKGEVEDWWQNKDPIKIFQQKLKDLGYLTDKMADKIEAECKQEFEEAAKFALNSPEPEPESAFKWIYMEEEAE